MKRSPKEWDFTVQPGPGIKLPSGGIYPPYGHIGHWEVTGTVSAKRALNAGKLLPQSHEVNEGHMTLPLDGKAIEHTVEWIGRQFGVSPTKSSFRAWPAAPEIRLPNSREDLMRRLEAEDELTLGDFVALISLV